MIRPLFDSDLEQVKVSLGKKRTSCRGLFCTNVTDEGRQGKEKRPWEDFTFIEKTTSNKKA